MTTPTLDVESFLARVYPNPPCWNLVTDVYTSVLGQQPNQVQTVSEAMRRAARTFRLELFKSREGMGQLEAPRDFAIVLMWRTSLKLLLHCGIYYQGCVLHALETGVLYQDLTTLREAFPLMEFWGQSEDDPATLPPP